MRHRRRAGWSRYWRRCGYNRRVSVGRLLHGLGEEVIRHVGQHRYLQVADHRDDARLLKQIADFALDAVLVRNLAAVSFFREAGIRMFGDYSLNVANPVSASVFRRMGIERITVSHDLNLSQILALLKSAPPDWFELTIHHHMPMFHMEHCIFAAFLSDGTDHTNCGRPCDAHRVHLRDRVGMEHPLRADVGCRNTLFHAVAQSGAGSFREFLSAGLRHFRVELLDETADEARHVIRAHQALLSGKTGGATLWKNLKVRSQIGVT